MQKWSWFTARVKKSVWCICKTGFLSVCDRKADMRWSSKRQQWGTLLTLCRLRLCSKIPTVCCCKQVKTNTSNYFQTTFEPGVVASSEAFLPPLQAQTFSRLLPMSLGTSWACNTPASREPSCPHTTPSPTHWGWARMTGKASSTCTDLTLKSCPHRRRRHPRHPRLHLHQTQSPMKSSRMWVELMQHLKIQSWGDFDSLNEKWRISSK